MGKPKNSEEDLPLNFEALRQSISSTLNEISAHLQQTTQTLEQALKDFEASENENNNDSQPTKTFYLINP